MLGSVVGSRLLTFAEIENGFVLGQRLNMLAGFF